jgi:hypothetical protein
MDFGENILLDMTIENVGVETALNVIATITCEDEYITLVNATADFGDIDASSTKTLAGAFEIEAAENIPDGRSLAFTISASNGTDSWESFFSIVAHAPQLEVTHVSLVETSGNFKQRK